jgi:hypothetical protein
MLQRQISSLAMENMGELVINKEPHDRKIAMLYKYSRDMETILSLGWFEHSSDWDPFLLIKLKSGTPIETASGYAVFNLSIGPEGYLTDKAFSLYIADISDRIKYIRVDSCDEKTNELIHIYLEIDKIHSILIDH